MNAVTQALNLPHSRLIALALLHFLWQGALIASLLALANALLARASARARYAAGCAALAAMLALPGVTAWRLSQPARSDPEAAAVHSDASPQARTASRENPHGTASTDALARFAPNIVLAWLAGVGLLSIRAGGGWWVASRLTRRGTRPAPPGCEARLAALVSRLPIRRPVRLLESIRLEVPSVIGVLRPVILVPAGMATGLTAEQMDALLAHELAHIRRGDFLVNLVQVAAETLLFYHPAVWWVSGRIRVERENVSDDLAVEVTGDAAVYARALVTLEERRATPRLAVAADGGQLWNRIARLLPPLGGEPVRASRALAAAAALGGVLAIGAGATLVAPAPARAAPAVAPAPTPSPAPAATSKPAPQSEPRTAAKPASASAKSAGLLSPQQLVAFRIHGVTPELIDEFEALGFKKVSADELVALRIHGASPEFIRKMSEAFGKLTLEECVAFRIHGVTPEFVAQMREQGLQNFSPDEAVAFRIHGVTPEFVKDVRALGYGKIEADELVAFRIHGVTPEYIRSMNQSAGGRLSSDELIEGRIYGHSQEEEENP